MRLVGRGKWGACAAVFSFVLAAAPALFVSDSAAQANAARRGAATRSGNRTTRRTRATTPARALQATPSPTPARVPQLDPSQPPPKQPTPLPQPTQQPPADRPPADAIDDDEVITVTSNLVVVPVSVTDAAGQPVQGLKAVDFRLEEEGRAQEIADVGAAEQVPLDIAILFDLSSSVSNRFEFQKQTVAGFLKQVMKPGDRAAVFAIRSEPELIQALAPAESAARQVLALPQPPRYVPTAFYDAVNAASKYLAQHAPGRHRRVVLVISDGDDNFSLPVREGEAEMARADLRGEEVKDSQRQRQEKLHLRVLGGVQREVQRADVVFYAINPSGGGLSLNQRGTRAQTGMQQLADATGGAAFNPRKIEELGPIFDRIAAELRAQYLIQYYSNSDAPAGKFLRIKVATPTRPEARVRARQGYYSKKG
ncbi:MAG TPA: VWA domain-containing protein [Pyrinomonadaceae bacterium]|nr:VWA domain-containing protein [Pyrinomonadaceae bacterium]